MFWDLTPAEFDRRLWAYNKKITEQNNLRSEIAKHSADQAISVAWMLAKMMRMKRIPSLGLILKPTARVVQGEEKKKMDADFDDIVRSVEGR